MYVAKTMTVAITKIAPMAGFAVMGWIIFIKLPFLLFKNSLRASRQEFQVQELPRTREEYKPDYSVKDYDKFLKQQSRLNAGESEKKAEAKEEPKAEKKEKPKQEQRQERRKEERKQTAAPKEKSGISPEETLFSLQAGQRYTKEDLKKRYHDLLKQSHPDKVASMGPDFKKMAELKTQEINSAYEKLKARAA